MLPLFPQGISLKASLLTRPSGGSLLTCGWGQANVGRVLVRVRLPIFLVKSHSCTWGSRRWVLEVHMETPNEALSDWGGKSKWGETTEAWGRIAGPQKLGPAQQWGGGT